MIDPYVTAAGKLRLELRAILDDGATLQDVSDLTGVQPSTISRLARGGPDGRSNPYIDTVLRIALGYNREPATLLPSLEQIRQCVELAREDVHKD